MACIFGGMKEMMAAICLLLPAVLFCLVRWKVIHKGISRSVEKWGIEYLLIVMLLNYFMLLVVTFGFHHMENLVNDLDRLNIFAVKYLSLSCLLAVSLPLVEKFIKEHVALTVEFSAVKFSFSHKRTALAGLAFFLVAINFIRIFDSNFWGDESYTANITGLPVYKMIETTAKDVHPPLYYLIVQGICYILGRSGPAFHFASLVPYILIVILALTYIYRKYGAQVSLLLMLFASLLNSSVIYNVEVRMYSWGEFWLLLSFLALHRVLEQGKAMDWGFFFLATMGAAYTHYYAMISVAFLYIALLGWAVFFHRELLKSTMIVSVLAILAYLPWLSFLFGAFGRTAAGYWMKDYPSFGKCLKFLFAAPHGAVFVAIFFLVVVLALAYEMGVLRIEKSEEKFWVRLNNFKNNLSIDAWWILAGLLALIGTIAVGIGVSIFFRPMFTERYLVPVAVIAWLLMGFCISKLRFRAFYTVAVVFLILVLCVPAYIGTYKFEKDRNDRLMATLSATQDIGDGIILTDIDHVEWTIAEHYYPGVRHRKVDIKNLPELSADVDYYLVLGKDLDEVQKAELTSRGYDVKNIIRHGNLGTHDVWIWRVRR